MSPVGVWALFLLPAGAVAFGNSMPILSEVLTRFRGQPIRRCPGRWVLRGIDESVGPECVVESNGIASVHVVATARDRVVVTRLGDWGLISYARADGTWLHTANTLEGFRRKLADLGIGLAVALLSHVTWCIGALLVCVFALPALEAEAGQVRLLSSNGVKAAIEAQRPQMEEWIGQTLITDFSTAASLKTRIETGEAFDAAILTAALIDDLVDQGLVVAESRRDFAWTGVGVGAQTDTPLADLSSLEHLKEALLNAETVVFTADGQSRRTIDRAFEALAIVDTMRPKTILVGPGQGPPFVVAGEAELVLTLVSEIVSVPGLRLLGPFPDQVQDRVVFAAGRSTRSSASDAAQALIEYLSESAFVDVLSAHGMDVP